MASRLEEKIGEYSNKFLDKRLVFAMDVVLSTFASFLVLAFVNLSLQVHTYGGRFALIWIGSSFVFSAFVSFVLKTYLIVIRHTSFRDVVFFSVASLIKAALVWSVMMICGYEYRFLIYIALLDWVATCVVLVGVRGFMIVVYEFYKSRLRNAQKKTRVLVYGTSEKSTAVIPRLRDSRHYEVLGLVTRDKGMVKSSILNKPVYAFESEEEFENLVNNLSLAGLVFSTDKDAQLEQDGLVRYCTDLGVNIFMIPTLEEMKNGQQIGRLREIKIEDLLGRDEIKISMTEIKANFAGKVVMVTGAAGSIGSELCRQLATFGIKKLVFYDNAETPMHNLRLEFDEKFPDVEYVPIIGDVRLPRRLDFAFRTYRPQIVFHAAAYKHVPLMEENPCEAVLVNVAGSRNVADKCIEYGIEKMVMISTDKAVNPTNIMGCTKRLAEIYVQSLGLAVESGEVKGVTRFITTRFGNVLGSNGSVIPRFRDQIAKGGPVTVTHPDIIRFFMTIPEACRLVMEAATMNMSNRICVFDMGKPVKIDFLARRMIELSGLRPDQDIKIEYTGLRPGEKLYEEVLSNVENTEPSSHERIRIAKVRSNEYAYAKEAVDKLEELSRAVDIPDMVRYMKEVVPEYISKNSKYAMYDKQ